MKTALAGNIQVRQHLGRLHCDAAQEHLMLDHIKDYLIYQYVRDRVQKRLVDGARATSFQRPPVAPEQCDTGPSGEWSNGALLIAYTGPVRSAAALRDSVLCRPTDFY